MNACGVAFLKKAVAQRLLNSAFRAPNSALP